MKINKNHREIIRHVSIMIGMDITDISKPIKQRGINLDVSRFNEHVVNHIYGLSGQYKLITVESGGYKQLYISLN